MPCTGHLDTPGAPAPATPPEPTCYRNGGGIFLIPYFIMLLVTGLPLFLMELSLGQYGAAGPITVWKCCPLLKGVGVAMLIVSSLVSLYYNVIIAWAFYYLGSSFQSPLPWSCDAPWNVDLCQVVYFTATFPYLVILILIIRGATLEGSLSGVRFYLSSDWSRLQSAQVTPDTLLIAIGNCCTSFLAGFAIFSVLGHMAWRKQVPVGSVAASGPGLAFVAYPEALSLLPGSPFWSILFFLMLFTLGVDTLFGNIEGITTAILDEFPALRDWRRKVALLGVLCTSFYLLGLLLVTQGGIFWFTLIDTYSTGFGLIIVALFMCLGIAFCYGVNQFCQDIVDMICRCPPWCSHMLGYFKACWAFFTPCLLLFTLIYTFLDMYGVPLRYGNYEFPDIVDMICRCPPWCSHMLGYFKACWAFFTPCLLLFTLIYTFLDMYGVPLRYGNYEFPGGAATDGSDHHFPQDHLPEDRGTRAELLKFT
ncbi:PREDICTED: sodium- and chloride-dependent glycine transporter 2-like [Charadrius vociferus]|uniref:sodium- and chloride-dependent glycine transporter 2-like n=1 Tax=Charadrius vociferus TaxID=50402 RepID=UPI000521B0E2|nr:PREDICTED: sodium- and chloride-dependent glycine transporter 2-like [Charadrius vociferus]